MEQLIRNILSSYAVRVIAIVVDFFMLPFLSSWLGMQELGAFFLVRNAVALFLQSDLGMGASTIRYVAISRAQNSRSTLDDVSNTSFAFFLVAGVALTPLFVIAMNGFWSRFADSPMTSEIRAAIVIAAVGNILVGLMWMFTRSVLIGVQRYDAANALQVTQSLLRALGTVAFILLGKGVVGAMTAEALSITLVFIGSLIVVHRIVPELVLNPMAAKMSLIREMFPYSAQMAVMGLLAFAIVQSGPLISGATVSIGLVAVYTAAQRIYLALKDMTSSLVQPLLPMAAFSRTEGNEQRLRTMLVRGTQVSNAISLALVIPVSLFIHEFIDAWVGDSFSEASTTALILLIGLTLNNNHLVAVSLLQGVGRVRAPMVFHGVWAVSTVVVGVWLSRPWGIQGVAAGMVLPLLLLEPLYIRAALTEFAVPTKSFVARAIVLPGIIAVGLGAPLAVWYESVEPLSIPTVLMLGAGICATYLLVVLMLATSREERTRVKDALRARLAWSTA